MIDLYLTKDCWGKILNFTGVAFTNYGSTI